MTLYVYNGKFCTEEMVDCYIAEEKELCKQRHLDRTSSASDRTLVEVKYDAGGCGVGLFHPETEEEWDNRMADWKERIKVESKEEYFQTKLDSYITVIHSTDSEGRCKTFKGIPKDSPHYYLVEKDIRKQMEGM